MEKLKKYLETRKELFKSYGINPESKFTTTDGPVRNVHYLEMGKGKDLILIHGGGSHSSEWVNILQPLSQKYKLYVVDLPGFGRNEFFDYCKVDYRQNSADFLGSFMDALDLKQSMIVANSNGGYFAVNFTISNPNRVSKLILIGAPAGLRRWVPLPLRLMGTPVINSLIMNTLLRPSIKNTKEFHEKILVADVNRLSQLYLKHTTWHMMLSSKTLKSFCETALDIKGWRKELTIQDRLDQLKVPVGFIWGNKDAFEKPQSGYEKVKQLENYKFEIVEDAGHCPWLDQPEKCKELIISMLG